MNARRERIGRLKGTGFSPYSTFPQIDVGFSPWGKFLGDSPRRVPTPLRSPQRLSRAAGRALVRYSMSYGDRDQYPVWVLPVQRRLSDYLRIPSLPITSR